jgi:hypothetical protein
LYDAVCDDVEVVFGDSVCALANDGGQHSSIRELVFGQEERFACHLGAYLSIFTVDNLLGLSDQAVLYNEPGRAAAMFTVRGNRRAEALLLFCSEPLGIDFRDQAAQQAPLRQRTAGMGWQTDRLVDAMACAYDFYFDEMSQIRLPSWSAGRVALLGDAAFGATHLHCGSTVFVPTRNRISVWTPTEWPPFCLRRGSASSRITRRCGCFPSSPGSAWASADASNGRRGRSACRRSHDHGRGVHRRRDPSNCVHQALEAGLASRGGGGAQQRLLVGDAHRCSSRDCYLHTRQRKSASAAQHA